MSRNNNAVKNTGKSKDTKLGKSRNNNAKKDSGSEDNVEGANGGFADGGFANSGSANVGMAWNSETKMDFNAFMNINSNAFEAQLEMVGITQFLTRVAIRVNSGEPPLSPQYSAHK